MTENGPERRTCIRFEIPGSTVSYKLSKLLSSKKAYGEEFCPVLDLSRGGMRFVCQNQIKINTRITMKMSIPGERIPLVLKGDVRWAAPNPGQSYKHQIGVQFNPYGEKKGQNYPGNLVKIIALEQKFSPDDEGGGKEAFTSDFEVDG
jgi:Tfp pilus assembly protein PilZ